MNKQEFFKINLKFYLNLVSNSIYFLFVYLIVFVPNYGYSQNNDSLYIYDLNLTQLSKIKISTVSKSAQSISEIPASVSIITEAQIKENGYFTLEEALSDLPGFQFRNILGFNSYVFQRGITSQNNLILVLIDGVQVNELNSGGFYGGGQYNLNNIERIEVIYGPSSVAYGTNAISGIINLVTKKPDGRNIEVSTLFGSFNTINSNFNYSYVDKQREWGILFSTMFKKTEKADLKGSNGDNNWTDLMDNFENDYSFDLKVNYKELKFGTNFLYKEASTATRTKSVGTSYKDYGTSWNIRFVNNYLKYKHLFSDKIYLSTMLYNRNTTVLDNTIYYIVDTAQVSFYRPNNLTGIENIINYQTNKWLSFTGGVSFEYERLSKKESMSYSDTFYLRPPLPSTPEMLNNTLLSLFLEPKITLPYNLCFSGGIRFDKSSVYEEVITPRAGLTYNLKQHIIRFAYAEAFRAPKPWDYTNGLGNPDLLPEKLKSFEIGFNIRLSEKNRVELIGYKNNLENAIVKENLSVGYRWSNEGRLKTIGFELFYRYESSKFKSSINYSYCETLNKNDKIIPEISNHTANASLTYSITNDLKINFRANYVGKRFNNQFISSANSNYIDPYLIFHTSFYFFNEKGFTAQIIVKNIFNTEYYHTSNLEPVRYRQPQRTIMLSVGYNIKY